MFQKATRRQAKLRLGLAGPSGSGKTASALLIAKGMGGKIALIDTENDSASLYAGQEINGQKMPEFDTLNLKPPYTTKAYITAMEAAVKAGYDILIIDSASHQWAGDGGILSRKETLDQKPGSNSYTNWGKFTPEHEQFKSAILQLPIHSIFTLRAKQEYALQSENGKNKVVKLGMAPVQREGMEYEFTAFLDIDATHYAESNKDRTGIFDGKRILITEEIGAKLKEWLGSGADAESTGVSLDSAQGVAGGADAALPPKGQASAIRPQQKKEVDLSRPTTNEELENLKAIAKKHLWQEHEFIDYMRRKYGTIMASKLTLGQAMEFHKVIVSTIGKNAIAALPAEKQTAIVPKAAQTDNPFFNELAQEDDVPIDSIPGFTGEPSPFESFSGGLSQ